MFIRIGADGSVALEEAANLRRLSIRMAGTAAADAALARLMRPDGADHAWIDPRQIRELAGSTAPDWDDGFAAMLAYARGKGWTDGTGAVRAHIERA